MAKELEKAQEELAALDLSFFGTLLNYRGGLNIILNNMAEDEVIKDMTTGICKRATYIMGVTNSQLLCGCKPMVGKEKEMVFGLSDLASVSLKSSFFLGHNIIIKTKSGAEHKFNSDDKKATTRFVNSAASLL